jgi:uncharacterized membrane protein YkvA (DUF1232 family)
MATDQPRQAVHWRPWIALICNIQPINLLPDFIPLMGLADNWRAGTV